MKYKNISITKRIDGRYMARPTIDKQTFFIYAMTQKECYDKLKEFFKNHKNNNLPTLINKRMSLYKWLDLWQKTYKKPFLKDSSYRSILICISKHIKNNINDILLSSIKPIDIDSALLKIESTKMRKETYNVYKESLREAFKNGLTKTDISLYINQVKHVEAPGHSLSALEQEKFIRALSNVKHRTMFLFYLYSGARASELSNLKWIDIKKDSIHIPGTKTAGSDRIIPKFKILEDLLNLTPNTNELVFNIQQRQLRRELEKINEATNLHIKIKDLRTTFATNCYNKGISKEYISKWLGHTTTKITDKYYIIKDKDKIDEKERLIFDSKFDSRFDSRFLEKIEKSAKKQKKQP